MYSFVSRLTPEQVEAIAAHLYVEMVKAGYTGVVEFHYLHNPPGGGATAKLRSWPGASRQARLRPASA